MNVIFKTLISLLIPFPQLLCNTSWKRDGILPNDKASKFESKNRDFNSIRDASKEEQHFYSMLDVDKRKVMDEHTKEDVNYDEEGSGDFELFESSSGNNADEFFSKSIYDFSGVEPNERDEYVNIVDGDANREFSGEGIFDGSGSDMDYFQYRVDQGHDVDETFSDKDGTNDISSYFHEAKIIDRIEEKASNLERNSIKRGEGLLQITSQRTNDISSKFQESKIVAEIGENTVNSERVEEELIEWPESRPVRGKVKSDNAIIRSVEKKKENVRCFQCSYGDLTKQSQDHVDQQWCQDPFYGPTKGIIEPLTCPMVDGLSARYCRKVIQEVTIHDVSYRDIIRTCGYHYDETNWDAEKQEFVDYEGYGIGCYHFMSYHGTGWANQSYISIICECDGQEGCNAAAIPSSLWITNFAAVVTMSYILMNNFISSII